MKKDLFRRLNVESFQYLIEKWKCYEHCIKTRPGFQPNSSEKNLSLIFIQRPN